MPKPCFSTSQCTYFQERAITGVRVNGVGPLIAASPTTHHDPNLAAIQPIDIHQYSQNPALWAGVDPIDPRRAMPPHAPLPPPAMQPSYAQMITAPYTDLSNEVSGYGIPANHYTVSMDAELDDEGSVAKSWGEGVAERKKWLNS
ncbi:unnamed protein product [Toxocara canis]|uniref:Uncharacterized protein n=1 Tax=Toxocara canis TaxID=6265 RepID=A0A3P7GSJ9_TOXCA|nr:unnamed protein product [Toxocara canis]